MLFLAASICAAEEPALKTQKDKVSYVIGTFVARDMKRQGIDLNGELFIKGFMDALSGAKLALSDKEAQEVMNAFRTEMDAKKRAETTKMADENKKQEEAFLSENKNKEGVHTLESGLQYKVIKEGSGHKPTLYDKVTVNYRGALINGTEFDSSYKRNQPATFALNSVIPGWSEALQLMKTGSKWQLFIPSKLAYGAAGAGSLIPPNAMLIFEVELLSIGEPAAQTPKAPQTGSAGSGAAPKTDNEDKKH
jgi:FKBP-type peptidyl-prolyl cis-trans isomerase FklB